MASPNKQQKRAHRAKAKAKQNRTQRAVATKPDAFAGDDSRIDLESVDLTELFQEAHRIEIIATGVLSLLVVAAGLFVSSRRKTQRAGAAVLN
jgi:hypothetical protein